MLMVNASCYDSSNIDTPNSSCPIVATSAGHYQLLTRPNFYTMHQGRQDHQLLYVRNGSIHYHLGEHLFHERLPFVHLRRACPVKFIKPVKPL